MGQGVGVSAVLPQHVPAIQYYSEEVPTAPAAPTVRVRGPIDVYRNETIKGLTEILEENRLRQAMRH